MCMKMLGEAEVTLSDTIAFTCLFICLYTLGIICILENIGII